MMGPNAIRDELNERIEQVRTVRVMTGGLDLFGVLKGLGLLVVILFATYWLGGCNARAERDAWWRNEIAQNSNAVRATIAKANGKLEKLDRDIIATLGETDTRLRDAEAALHNDQIRTAKDCQPLPRHCFGGL